MFNYFLSLSVSVPVSDAFVNVLSIVVFFSLVLVSLISFYEEKHIKETKIKTNCCKIPSLKCQCKILILGFGLDHSLLQTTVSRRIYGVME